METNSCDLKERSILETNIDEVKQGHGSQLPIRDEFG